MENGVDYSAVLVGKNAETVMENPGKIMGFDSGKLLGTQAEKQLHYKLLLWRGLGAKPVTTVS